MNKKLHLALVSTLICTLCITLLSSCSNKNPQGKTYEIALVTDTGHIDDKAFNQTTWEAISKFGNENNINYKHYPPTTSSHEAYIDAIDLAISSGAKIIITPGYFFANTLYKIQDSYSDTKFIIIDSEPISDSGKIKIGENVYCLKFNDSQAGFLAGYASVKEGYKNIGITSGVEVPPVLDRCYGFIMGAEMAAKELDIKDVSIDYTCLGDFLDSYEHEILAERWFNEGKEIIFPATGAGCKSIIRAAETTDKDIFGIDVDQSYLSETVMLSSLKNVGIGTYNALVKYYKKDLAFGSAEIITVTDNGVGLSMNNSKFINFTNDDYLKLKENIINNNYDIFTINDYSYIDKLPLIYINLNLR